MKDIRPKLRKHLTQPKILLIILVVPSVVFVFYQSFMYFNPMLRINFRTFAPSNKIIEEPSLVLITQWIREQDTLIFPKASIEFKTDGGKTQVRLRKPEFSFYECEPQAINSVCHMERTPAGVTYKYTVTEGHEAIAFNKEGTLVLITNDDGRTDSIKQWSEFIDSFGYVEFKNLPVVRRPNSPF